jgi:hypothetical protein
MIRGLQYRFISSYVGHGTQRIESLSTRYAWNHVHCKGSDLTAGKSFHKRFVLHGLDEGYQSSTWFDLGDFCFDVRGADLEQDVALRPHGVAIDHGGTDMLVDFVSEFGMVASTTFDENAREAFLQQQRDVLGGDSDASFALESLCGDTNG